MKCLICDPDSFLQDVIFLFFALSFAHKDPKKNLTHSKYLGATRHTLDYFKVSWLIKDNNGKDTAFTSRV